MKLLGITLNGYIPFMDNGIRTFTAKFDSDYQVILGTNGSGKSSYLRQLSPLPPSREDFVKTGEGYKCLIISHNGSLYKLVTDFSNLKSPHEFYKDDFNTNINDSGSTTIQNELIRDELGYTKFVDDILYCRYHLTKMKGGERRALFMEANPWKIAFILDEFKAINSKARVLKGMIAKLTERKVSLEAQMIDDADLSEYEEKKKSLTEEITTHIATLHRITHEIRTLEEKIRDLDPSYVYSVSVDDVTSFITDFYHRARSDWSPYFGKDCGEMITKIDHALGEITGLLKAKYDRLTEIANQIDECQTNLSHVEDLPSVTEVKLKHKSLEKELAEYQATYNKDLSLLPNLSTEEFTHALSKLNDIITTLTTLVDHTPAVSTAAYRRKELQFKYWFERLNYYRRVIDRLTEEKAPLVDARCITVSDIPDSPCAKEACALYRGCKSQVDVLTTKIERIDKDLKFAEHMLRRIETYIEHRSEFLNAHSRRVFLQIELYSLANTHSWMMPFFQIPDLLDRIARNPSTLYNSVERSVRSTQSYYKIQQLTYQLAICERELAEVSGDKETESKRLHGVLEKLKTTYTRIRGEVATLEKEQQTAEKTKDSLKEYRESCESVKHYSEVLGQRITLETYKHELQKLMTLREDVTQLKNRCVSDLGDIDQTLRSQETIKARYNEEVMATLGELEYDRECCIAIAKGLERIPQLYSVSFANDIISTMNTYLENAVTYHYQLDILDPQHVFDYKFPLENKGTHKLDVSLGSEFQRDIVDLVFNLALRHVLNLQDYPIFLDETGSSFDYAHKYRLVSLLKQIVSDGAVTQLFLINHHASVHEGLSNAEVLVLDPSNVMVPDVYNQHVDMS